MNKTLRRDKLKRDIQKGLYLGKCCYRYTDDYAYDNAANFGETNLLPVNIITNNSERKEGHINLWESDFEGSCGSCWVDEKGEVSLVVHSNLAYEFVKKAA